MIAKYLKQKTLGDNVSKVSLRFSLIAQRETPLNTFSTKKIVYAFFNCFRTFNINKLWKNYMNKYRYVISEFPSSVSPTFAAFVTGVALDHPLQQILFSNANTAREWISRVNTAKNLHTSAKFSEDATCFHYVKLEYTAPNFIECGDKVSSFGKCCYFFDTRTWRFFFQYFHRTIFCSW